MGGYGSTRWGSVRTKYAAEDCRKLSIFFLRPYLKPGPIQTLTWSRDGERIADISYWVIGQDTPETIHLIYTTTRKGSKPKDYNYPVRLATSEVYRGGRRYWFICPGGCGRRVGCLYLAPGSEYFTCRHCNKLSYRSRQDGYGELALYRYLLPYMKTLPRDMTPRELKRLLDYSGWLNTVA